MAKGKISRSGSATASAASAAGTSGSSLPIHPGRFSELDYGIPGCRRRTALVTFYQTRNEEAVMTVSDDLSRLSARAKEAQDRVASAKTKARDHLEQDVENARKNTQKAAEQMRAQRDAAAAVADAWGDDIQRSWNDHIQRMRQRMDDRKAKHDAKVAERDAQDAEDYAAFAIDFAYSAIEEAEYAVLDAVLYREDADAVGSTATT